MKFKKKKYVAISRLKESVDLFLMMLTISEDF
jgi:hypothetical protein